MKKTISVLMLAAAVGAAACGGESTKSETVSLSPLAPTGGSSGSGTVTLSAPAAVSPMNDEFTTSLRPTLTVTNATSSQPSGTRTYEFQIADNSAFSIGGGVYSATFVVVSTKTGIAEDASGKTSYTPDADLQPTTRFYWRARVTQGSTTSEWSTSQSFRTRITGYIRAGELYDPLTNEVTVGEAVGATSFVTDKGLRLDSETSYVRYNLPSVVTTGEFSMEVEGIGSNIPKLAGLVNKMKIFSMWDGNGDFDSNAWRVDAQYRGLEGNPDNCIQWRALFGGSQYKFEPDTAARYASSVPLDASKTYYWKGTWDRGFRLEVFEGGIGGTRLYDRGLSIGASYTPQAHVANLGAPRGAYSEMSVVVGAIYRNVWMGSSARPTSLGSALRALR